MKTKKVNPQNDILKLARIIAVNKIADKTNLDGLLDPDYKISVDRENGRFVISPKFDRRKLLRALTKAAKACGYKCITKTIPFQNDDVPRFLKKLHEFEKRSRKVCLIVK